MAPRIPPLPVDGRDPRTEELLAPLRRPDGTELNIFATLARHPKLFKRWSAFGGMLLYGGMLPARERELLILRTGLPVPGATTSGASTSRSAGPPGSATTRSLASPTARRRRLVGGRRRPPAGRGRAARRQPHRRRRPGPPSPTAGTSSSSSRSAWWSGQYHLVAFTLNSLGVEPESDDFPVAPGMSGALAGRRVLVVGAGTRPIDDPDAPDRQRPGHRRRRRAGRGRPSPAPTSTPRPREATAALVEAEGATAHVLGGDVTDAAACAGLDRGAPPPRWAGSTGSCSTSASAPGMGMQGTTPEQWDSRVRRQRARRTSCSPRPRWR